MDANPFTSHPREVGESYGRHFLNAAGFGLTMVGGGIAVLIHAFLPFLFVRTGSQTMGRLHRRMTGRTDKVDWERHPII